MNRLSRNLAVAGLAIVGGDAVAATPLRLWQHATHFTLTCRVAGKSPATDAALCARLAAIASRHLRLAHRPIADAGGIALTVDLIDAGKDYRGKLVASRAAFEGETDEQSPPVAIAFDGRAPDSGFVAALDRLRQPSAAPKFRRGPLPVRPT